MTDSEQQVWREAYCAFLRGRSSHDTLSVLEWAARAAEHAVKSFRIAMARR